MTGDQNPGAPSDLPGPQEWGKQAAAERRASRLAAMREHTESRIPPQFAAAQAPFDERVAGWVRVITARATTQSPEGEVPVISKRTSFTAGRRNEPEKFSLLISGPTGTGKTFSAFAAMRALADAGVWVLWERVTAADLYASLRPRPGHDAEGEFQRIRRAPVLIVDDLAAAKGSEWIEEVNFRLVNYRYEDCRPTIFTTNWPPGKLPVILGARVASRLTEMCQSVELKGRDRRVQP